MKPIERRERGENADRNTPADLVSGIRQTAQTQSDIPQRPAPPAARIDQFDCRPDPCPGIAAFEDQDTCLRLGFAFQIAIPGYRRDIAFRLEREHDGMQVLDIT